MDSADDIFAAKQAAFSDRAARRRRLFWLSMISDEGPVDGEDPVLSIELADQDATATPATIYNFSGSQLGAASADRKILVGVSYRASVPLTVVSVTVGGVTASLVNETASGGNLSRTSFYFASVPNGATGDVVITLSGEALRCGIGVWAIKGSVSLSGASATGTSTADIPGATLLVPRNGVVVAYGFAADGVAPVTADWSTNLTEQFDAVIATTFTHTGAHAAFSSGGLQLFECIWSATPSIGAGVVFAAFGP